MNTILTLQDVAQARVFYERGYWRPQTLYMLLRAWAETQPDRFALRDCRTRLTFQAVVEWVDALSHHMHRCGLKTGDRVSIWSPSRVETAIIFLACSRMGYVCNTSLHRDYTCEEIAALLQRAGSTAFFVQPGFGANGAKRNIFALLEGLHTLTQIYSLDELVPNADEPELPAMFGALTRTADASLPFSTDPDRVVYLAYTSGTTGQPKGVMHSNNTILANSRAMVRDWGFDNQTIVYSFSPMSHNIGIVGLAVALTAGAEFVVHTPFDASRMFDRVVETGATFLLGVPTHGLDLLSEVRRRRMSTLGNVKAFEIGGSAVPPALVEGLLDIGVVTQNAFGMTENHSFQYTRPDDTPSTIATTCGKPAEGMEIKLWLESNQDHDVPQGAVGELGVRGPSLMLGYFGDQVATEGSFNSQGWFMTGDLARLDQHGNLQIVGRKKDLIIRGGHNIYPARIEDFIMRHPAVAKAAAFPVADERLGERVCLAVIPRRDAAISPMELLSHLNDHGLSKYDMPEYFVAMDSFPLTASGKVLKRRLVEMVVEGQLAPQPIRWQG
ncbi:MAG: acyl--CoA ligase [Hyphomicrobiales bacterium]|nr:acyl--CoA ligase [Hyphomicrobiales bacterium]